MAASSSVYPTALSAAAALLPVTDPVAGPWGLMAALLFITFVLHLLLMNALLGLALLALAERLRLPGMRLQAPGAAQFRESDLLLPKAVAFTVNLGVPPFLFLQCIYGQYIYSSSILMGLWWLSLMGLVMLAYYGLYINMTRHGLSDAARTTALFLACLLLLGAAFIFVNNMTLLQAPGNWARYAEEAGGTLLNLTDPQLAPRYLHIVLACLAVGGLCRAFLAAQALKRSLPGGPEAVEAQDRRREGLGIFFAVSLLQLPVGLWFFWSLPGQTSRIFTGGDALATALFWLCPPLLAVALFMARKNKLALSALCAGLIIVCMAGMRALLRSACLEGIYDPPMRAMDLPPFVLFIVSLAATLLALVWMLRLYFRYSGLEYDADKRPLVTPPAATTARPMSGEEARDALLINETARAPGDDSPHGDRGAAL